MCSSTASGSPKFVSLLNCFNFFEIPRNAASVLPFFFNSQIVLKIRDVKGSSNVDGTGFEPATSGHRAFGLHCSPDYESRLVSFSKVPDVYEVNYGSVKGNFAEWLKSKRLNERYVACMISYLDRFVNNKLIKSPMDVVRIFSGLTSGQQHNLIHALRALFNFLGAMGVNEAWLDMLRKNIPRDEVGIDLWVPSEEQIVNSLKKMERTELIQHKAAYRLALESGLRLTEVVRLIKNFNQTEVQSANGFYVVPIGYFRRSKLAYYAFFKDRSKRLMENVSMDDARTLSDKNATKYVQKRVDVVAYKYLRKFVFDKMIELGVPESVADFIQGRTPKSVGAKHYMMLVRQAKQYYPKYAEYLETIVG